MSEAESEQCQIGNEQKPEGSRIEKKSVCDLFVSGQRQSVTMIGILIALPLDPSNLFCYDWYVYHSLCDNLQPPFLGTLLSSSIHC